MRDSLACGPRINGYVIRWYGHQENASLKASPGNAKFIQPYNTGIIGHIGQIEALLLLFLPTSSEDFLSEPSPRL